MSDNRENLPVLKIIKPSVHSSVQDRGRFGYRHLGVPWSGVMDSQSYNYVNQKLQNELNAPVLEAIGSGLEIIAINDVFIFWSGADCLINIDDVEYPNLNEPIKLKADQILKIKKMLNGFVWYLGIKGGFYVPEIMNSASMWNRKDILKKKDLLYGKSRSNHIFQLSHIAFSKLQIDNSKYIEAKPGPEYDWLTEESKSQLFSNEFIITKQSDRMGYRLNGIPLQKKIPKEMLTSAVLPGTVQLLPDGQMIILMRDCQTTGGYPRILQIGESSLNQLAHKCAGVIVRFSLY